MGKAMSIRRRLAAGVVLTFALAWGIGGARAAMVPDPGFGDDGIVTTQVGGPGDWGSAFALAVQADGKLVAAGGLDEDEFALARYNADGSPDTGFGAGGKVTTNLTSGGSTYADEARAVSIQSDGKILAAGFAGAFPNSGGNAGTFALVRYNANGSLDTGFGTGGKVVIDGGTLDGPAYAMALQPDGKIVLAGGAFNFDLDSSSDDFALARFNTDGSLDSGFGDGGIVLTDLGGSAEDQANAVAIQSDGKIVAAGYGNDFEGDFALARYNANGTLDPSFGTGGKVTTPVSTNPNPFNMDAAYALVIQPDGKLVAAGYAQATTPWGAIREDFALVRYNSNGTVDTGFGSGGTATTHFGYFGGPAHGLALQADGKLVAAGRAEVCGDDCNFGSARFNADGSLDPSYSGSGRITTAVAPHEQIDYAHAVAIQPDGGVVLAGTADVGPLEYAEFQFALVRYLDIPGAAHLKPNALIRLGNGKWKGGDVYNVDGARQTSSTGARRGQTKTFWVKAKNDGNVSDTLSVSGIGGSRKWVVKYFFGGENVTGEIRDGTFDFGDASLAPGQSQQLKLTIRPKRTAKVGSTLSVKVTIASRGDPDKKDAVRARVTVKRR